MDLKTVIYEIALANLIEFESFSKVFEDTPAEVTFAPMPTGLQICLYPNGPKWLASHDAEFLRKMSCYCHIKRIQQ